MTDAFSPADAPLNDLDWLAFCYATGEANEQQAAQFEDLLATSQAAREALARAVQLSEVICQAEAVAGRASVQGLPTPALKPRRELKFAGGMLVPLFSAATAMALLLGAYWLRNGNSLFELGKMGPGNSPTDTTQLASAWIEHSSNAFDLYGSTTSDELDLGGESATPSSDDLASNNPPSWMTAGLASLAGEALDLDEPHPAERLEN